MVLRASLDSLMGYAVSPEPFTKYDDYPSPYIEGFDAEVLDSKHAYVT